MRTSCQKHPRRHAWARSASRLPSASGRPRVGRDHVGAKLTKGEFFLEAFSGSDLVASSARKYGFMAREYATLHGVNFDLCSKSVLRNLHRDVQRWNLVAAMFGTPCTSFSVARDRTSVIRSREYPYGVPGLSIADAEKVAVGNSTAFATVRIVGGLHTRKIPWCIENPHSSKLWYFPEIE